MKNVINFSDPNLDMAPCYVEDSYMGFLYDNGHCTMHFQLNDPVSLISGTEYTAMTFDMGMYESEERAENVCLRQVRKFLRSLRVNLTATKKFFENDFEELVECIDEEVYIRQTEGYTSVSPTFTVREDSDTQIRIYAELKTFRQNFRMSKDGRQVYIKMNSYDKDAKAIVENFAAKIEEEIERIDRYVARIDSKLK